MRTVSLLKACIISGLSLMWLAANAEETPEYAAVPPNDCHYAEHPIIRETTSSKYRRVATRHVKHHAHVRHKVRSTNSLVAYYPFSSPSYFDNMWPSDCCHCWMSGEGCAQNEYVVSALTPDQLMYNLMYESPRPTGYVEESCDAD